MEKTKHLAFRFPIKDISLLKRVSKERGEDMSDFVRRATRKELARLSYLGPAAKKALEVEK